jgi:FMN phosphatase YigB (HAD superfamily)
MDEAYFEGFNADLHDAARWDAFWKVQQSKDPKLPKEVPPLPKLDARYLFTNMMTISTAPDPWMFPALKNLKASNKYILAAVSNTVIFPEGNPLHERDFFASPVRSLFDVFVSSAHVGMRKPDPKIYDFTLKEINKFALMHGSTKQNGRSRFSGGIAPGDVLFLDDIGENLKAGKRHGFQTIKVNLGRAFEAVDELERVTGLKLAGDHPRIPIKPKFGKSKAKI